MSALFSVFLYFALVLSPYGWQAEASDLPRERAVVLAVLKGPVSARLVQWQGTSDKQRIALSVEALTNCRPGGARRCIPPDAYQVAATAASRGRIPDRLANVFARSSTSHALPSIEFPGLSLVDKLQDLPGDGPYAMAVSAPAYLDGKGVLFVQFGHGYNNYSFIAVLQDVPNKGWMVTDELVVSVGN